MTCCYAFKANDDYPLCASNAKLTQVQPRLSRFLKSSVAGVVLVVEVRSVPGAAVMVRSVPVAGAMFQCVPGAVVQCVPGAVVQCVPGAVVGALVAQSADLKTSWIFSQLPCQYFQSYQ